MSSEDNHNISFWIKAWENNRSFWHLPKPNEAIIMHGEEWLGNDKKDRVFFPLCGKTTDMSHVASLGHSVIGAEAHEACFDEFSKENDGSCTKDSSTLPSVSECTSMNVFKFKSNDDSKNLDITFIGGDFFELEKPTLSETEKFTHAFDRGSLVAIQPELRENYVRIMDNVMGTGSKILFYGVHFDQAQRNPPPNSMSIEDVQNLYLNLPQGVDRFEFKVLSVDKENCRYLKAHGGTLEWADQFCLLITKKE